MRIWTILLASICLLLAVSGWGAAQSTSLDNMTVGKMSVSFNQWDGFSLRYGGVSVIKASSLIIHTPSWSNAFYSYENGDRSVTVQTIPNGKQALIKLHSGVFDGTQRVTLTENNARFELTYKVNNLTDKAQIEYCAGHLSAPILAGYRYQAQGSWGQMSDVIPLTTKIPNPKETFITKDPFKTLSIDSRIGKITIDSIDAYGLSVFDCRKYKIAWAEKHPIFWCGISPEDILVPGKEYRMVTNIKIEPRMVKSLQAVSSTGSNAKVTDTRELREIGAGPIVVIPEPKKMTLLKGDFLLTNQTTLVVSNKAKPEDIRGAYSFADEINAVYGIKLKIAREKNVKAQTPVILIGETSLNPSAAKAAKAEMITDPHQAEGYALKVTPKRVLVIGSDQQGSYYGMQTLKQLVKIIKGKVYLQGCQISDYPSMKYRGVHLFIGKDALPFHQKLIDRIFARYKMNNLILESDYLKWKSCPEIAINFSMEQDNLKKDIQFARNHFMEVSPLVQSLGHSEWMFQNKTNLDLCEDTTFPYAYCPSNPKTYDFIFKIYDEALELFGNPRYFHIGHDEVTLFAKFPKDSVCSQKSLTDLVIGDIQKLHDHFSKKGVKLVMWGDMFLGPGEAPDACSAESLEEAKKRRDMLPKDIVIADWHYVDVASEQFYSPKILKNEGFENIASTWYTPGNIVNFADAAKKAGSLGLLQTTWSGFDSNESNLKGSYEQFTAMILAADYAWNSNKTKLEDLPYRPDEEFNKQWNRSKADLTPRKGFVVDLNPIYNTKLSGSEGEQDWNSLVAGDSIVDLPTGLSRVRDDLYQFAAESADHQAVRVASLLDAKYAYPEKVTIPVNRKAADLLFLHTAAWIMTPGQAAGQYTIQYKDGTKEEIKLIYGNNISAWDDTRTTLNAYVVWNGKSKSGQQALIRRLTWQNPHPEKMIQSIEIDSANAEAGVALLAVSGLSAQ